MHSSRYFIFLLTCIFSLLCTQTVEAASSEHALITTTKSGLWSDASVWSTNAVPHAGDAVRILPQHTITYDMNSTDLIRSVQVSGTLQFAINQNTLLTVDAMNVTGTFRIGSKRNPVPAQHTARIQFDGPERSLMSTNGRIEWHGATTGRTWTRLAHTARPGSDTITLKKPTRWKPNDEIVIASTSYNPSEAEQRTIRSVSPDGKTLRLTQPLTYLHYGEDRQFAEVGLLTHTVQFRGAGDDHGGHIMFMSDGTAQNRGAVRISGASFTRLGNFGEMAQYPVHFHMMGDQQGSHITASSISDSSNRCVTVHGTDGVLVKDVVGYNTKGHCFFLEDGVERNNRFIHNLGVWTQPGTTIPSDAQPATFWITNPSNTYARNAAAGSDAFGFWFFFLDHPSGLSQEHQMHTEMKPNTLPLHRFDRNVSHSNRSHGFTLDRHGFEHVTYHPPTSAVFSRLTAYKNINNGFWMRGHDLQFTGLLAMDNKIGVAFPAQHVTLSDALIIGASSTPSPNTFPWMRGYDFYDGPNRIERVTFQGFTGANRSAIGLQPNNPFYMSRENQLTHLTFIDALEFSFQTPMRNGEKVAVVYDAEHNQTLTPLLPFHQSEGCVVNAVWNAYVCPHIPYGKLTYLHGLADGAIAPSTFTVTRLDTGTSLELATEGSSMNGRFVMNVPEGNAYRISAGNSSGMRLIYEGDEAMTVRVPFAQAPLRIVESELTASRNQADVTDWAYDPERAEVVLKLRGDKQYLFL